MTSDEESDKPFSEEDEEEEEEPKLKYQRVGNNVIEILKDDSVVKLTVLLTKNSFIYVLDFNGNEIRRFQQSNSTITDVSVDENEEFIATCATNGKVTVYSVCSDEVQVFSYKMGLNCIALDPLYGKKVNRQFVIGGEIGRLVMHEKEGWIGNKENVLHSGEGPIYEIKWSGSLIAWVNETGVKVYDCSSFHKISHVSRPKLSASKVGCHITWKDSSFLLMSWGSTVKIGVIKEKNKMEVNPGGPSKYMEIISILECDYIVCGISPFFTEYALLAFTTKHSSEDKSTRPEIRVVKTDGEEISSDALSIMGFEDLDHEDYKLAHVEGDNLFYITSPKEIIMCKPRDIDDHISWLMEREKYEEALLTAERGEEEKTIVLHSILQVGQAYLEYLVKQKNYSFAGEICHRILGKDVQEWEHWVFLFAEHHQLKAIAQFVPVDNPRLSDTLYEMILAYFLTFDPFQFHKLITVWPLTVFNMDNITHALEDQIEKISKTPREDPESLDYLVESMAFLYEKDGRYDKALKYYLMLKKDHIFDLINHHNLFENIQNKVLLIAQFHEPNNPNIPTDWHKWRSSPSIQLLVNNVDKISVEEVVKQLKGHDKYLHVYLDALFDRDIHIASAYHHLQLELYAEYDYSRLSEFLRASNEYPLEKALQVCQKRNFIPEMVFILGRMGNPKKALNLIVNSLDDVKKALEFAKEYNDEDLWDELVGLSLHKPAFICGLLENSDSVINPVRIIERIPNDLQVPGLRTTLIKVLQDLNLQASLLQGCQAILNGDGIALLERLHQDQLKSIFIESEVSTCGVCNRIIWEVKKQDLVLFNCGHEYHINCIEEIKERENQNTNSSTSSSVTTSQASRPKASSKKGPSQCPSCQ